MQAKQAIAQGRGPITYFKDGVPGGVSSRPDVRLGFEVEFKLLGDNFDVSFDRRLTRVQYVRVAQIMKVSEALLYRLGNVAGGDGSKQRKVAHAAPVSLPPDPYTVDEKVRMPTRTTPCPTRATSTMQCVLRSLVPRTIDSSSGSRLGTRVS